MKGAISFLEIKAFCQTDDTLQTGCRTFPEIQNERKFYLYFIIIIIIINLIASLYTVAMGTVAVREMI